MRSICIVPHWVDKQGRLQITFRNALKLIELLEKFIVAGGHTTTFNTHPTCSLCKIIQTCVDWILIKNDQ